MSSMKWNEDFFNELGNSAAVERIVVDAANTVAQRARAIAPVDTGEYAANIKVRTRRTRHRVIAEVVATAEHSLLVESQNGTLARALGALKSRG